jgi:trk system potassium uptake protein TrkH
MLGNMSFFDSLCHAMGTLATGGFSTKNTSIAEFSPYIQIVITIFMFFGGVNFTLHYFLLKGKFKKVFYNEEWLKFAGFLIVISLLVSFITYFEGNYDFYTDALRHSFFQCTSILTATGFATADYMIWPQASWIFIFLLFFTGGMIGSTAGGTKFTRHLVLFKNLRAEIKRLIHPRAIISIRINKVNISEDISRNFFIIFIAYLLVFVTGSLLMSMFVENAVEAFGVTISCLGGVGPAFGQYGPTGNYSMIPDAGKWILSIIMVIGRLEVIPVLIFFHYAFWKK